MFKVGDIIEPLESSNTEYSITNKKKQCICKVISIGENNSSIESYVRVMVVNNINKMCIGTTYWVKSKYFTSYKDNKITLNHLKGQIHNV